MKKSTIGWIALGLSMIVAYSWDSAKTAWIKSGIHLGLDPTAGALLDWNLTVGMLLIVFLLSLLITLIQKYTTDQVALRALKKQQKAMQKEMKEAKSDPKKMASLQKENMVLIPQQFKLSMGSMAYTAIPFVLFFRWFNDYFLAAGNPKFFGFMGWFIFYLLFSIIFSSVLKKKLDVA
mgnify:CR=1 FL=1